MQGLVSAANDLASYYKQHRSANNRLQLQIMELIKELFDQTPLHIACCSVYMWKNSKAMIIHLANLCGAERCSELVNLQDKDRLTSLHCLVMNIHYNKEKEHTDLIETLFSLGADPNIRDRYGLTALDYLKLRCKDELEVVNGVYKNNGNFRPGGTECR